MIKTINEQIKKERLKQGLTMYAAAKAMGISQTHYKKLETNTNSPSLALLSKACIALGVDAVISHDGKQTITKVNK